MNPRPSTPASPRSRWARRIALGCLAGLSFGACSSDETNSKALPSGPADLSLAGSLDCQGLLSVRLSLDWILRPPFTCAGLPNCGSVRLSVDFADGTPPLAVTANASPFLVDLRAYGEATRQSLIGHPGALSAVLVDDLGNPADVVDGSTATGTVELDCDDAGNGEAGASGVDDGGLAGASDN